MNKNNQEAQVIVGLDIGTSKIGAIIAEIDQFESLKILGVGASPSDGLRRGVVINLDKTVKSISTAIKEAELMSGYEIQSVYAGIAGDHIRSLNSRGVVAISRNDNEITSDDIGRAIDAAKAIAIPMDREIIHILPQEYIVDDQDGIKDPVGMSGVRLEVDAHIVTGAITSAQNIYKSIERAGMQVQDIVLEPLASSYSVLTEDEKELGVGLIDLGGGTADIAIFYEGSIRHTAVIGLGGAFVTNDVARGLRTPLEQAEKIKIMHGCCFQPLVDTKEVLEVPSVGGRPPRQVSKSVLTSIIQPRMEEILSLALREIRRSGFMDLMTTGLVLTGGGSMIDGTVDLAEQIFDMPTKLGYPKGFGGLVEEARHPRFATSIGLVLYGLQHKNERHEVFEKDDNPVFDKILTRMKRWFMEFF